MYKQVHSKIFILFCHIGIIATIEIIRINKSKYYSKKCAQKRMILPKLSSNTVQEFSAWILFLGRNKKSSQTIFCANCEITTCFFKKTYFCISKYYFLLKSKEGFYYCTVADDNFVWKYM